MSLAVQHEDTENRVRRTVNLGMNQVERAMLLTNDIISEGLCESISPELEARLSALRTTLSEMSALFYATGAKV